VARDGSKRIFGGYYICLFASGGDTIEGKPLKQETLDMIGMRKPTNPLPKSTINLNRTVKTNHSNPLDIDQRHIAKRSFYSQKLVNFS